MTEMALRGRLATALLLGAGVAGLLGLANLVSNRWYEARVAAREPAVWPAARFAPAVMRAALGAAPAPALRTTDPRPVPPAILRALALRFAPPPVAPPAPVAPVPAVARPRPPPPLEPLDEDLWAR